MGGDYWFRADSQPDRIDYCDEDSFSSSDTCLCGQCGKSTTSVSMEHFQCRRVDLQMQRPSIINLHCVDALQSITSTQHSMRSQARYLFIFIAPLFVASHIITRHIHMPKEDGYAKGNNAILSCRLV